MPFQRIHKRRFWLKIAVTKHKNDDRVCKKRNDVKRKHRDELYWFSWFCFFSCWCLRTVLFRLQKPNSTKLEQHISRETRGTQSSTTTIERRDDRSFWKLLKHLQLESSQILKSSCIFHALFIYNVCNWFYFHTSLQTIGSMRWNIENWRSKHLITNLNTGWDGSNNLNIFHIFLHFLLNFLVKVFKFIKIASFKFLSRDLKFSI